VGDIICGHLPDRKGRKRVSIIGTELTVAVAPHGKPADAAGRRRAFGSNRLADSTVTGGGLQPPCPSHASAEQPSTPWPFYAVRMRRLPSEIAPTTIMPLIPHSPQCSRHATRACGCLNNDSAGSCWRAFLAVGKLGTRNGTQHLGTNGKSSRHGSVGDLVTAPRPCYAMR
jgi:hypothetical protein